MKPFFSSRIKYLEALCYHSTCSFSLTKSEIMETRIISIEFWMGELWCCKHLSNLLESEQDCWYKTVST